MALEGTSVQFSYPELIKSAIYALGKKTGSSKAEITRFLKENETDLGSTNRWLVFFHLKRLVDNGELVKVRSVYKLPTFAPKRQSGRLQKEKSIASDGSIVPLKRGRGRPPKRWSGHLQKGKSIASDSSIVPLKRGRGRPPKKRGRGRPPKKRAPGRPLMKKGRGLVSKLMDIVQSEVPLVVLE